MLIYVDGKLLPKDEAKVSVFDHGVLYGDGVFEGIRVYDGNIFKLKEHIERLYESAKTIWLNIPLTSREMEKATIDTVAANGLRDAYIRLVDVEKAQHWNSRGHFFAAAARSMRQILINRAIRKQAKKHGGDLGRQEFDEAMFATEPPPERMLALNEALERLEAIDERKGRIVMLRYFSALSIEDTASALGLSPATVKREWQFARTWLHREMSK